MNLSNVKIILKNKVRFQLIQEMETTINTIKSKDSSLKFQSKQMIIHKAKFLSKSL